MKRLSLIVVCLIGLGLLFGACGRPAEVPGRQATATPVPKGQPITGATSATSSWDHIVAEARKEGVVSVYSFWGPQTRVAVLDAFKKKHGLDVEFTAFSRGEEVLVRVQNENRAGLYQADVYGVGGATLVNTMKPAGILAPIDPILVLPEARDVKSWTGGVLPYQENDKLGLGFSAYINRFIAYNTDQIKKGEITTYRDLLKPQYKGKITLQDPTVTGMGNTLMVHLGVDLWDSEQATDFLRQLVKQQEVVVQRDLRLHIETVAKGKFAIALGPQSTTLADFLRAGAPMELLVAKDGSFVSSGAGAVAVPPKMAHPNAARLFVNWLLTREGQSAFARGYGIPSLRTDASTEGIMPTFLPQAGEKLFLDSEKHFEWRGKMLEIARNVLKEAQK